MLHYSDDGIELSGDRVGVIDEHAGAIEDLISLVGDIPCSIPIEPKPWCEAEVAQRVAH